MSMQTRTESRIQRSAELREQRAAQINKATELKERGYSNIAIAKQMNISESSVRKLLKAGL